MTVEGVDYRELYGENDVKLDLLRKAFPDVSITARGSNLRLLGEKKYTQRAKAKFEAMVRVVREQDCLSIQTLHRLLGDEGSEIFRGDTLLYGRNSRRIAPKTPNQRRLVQAIEENDIVFGIGPAGTGKTYMAVVMAVRALKNKLVRKIILTRPAVEAGESLGFLPGDLKEKVDPYLRPLYDALDDLLPADKLNYFMQNRTIEVAPLAFMRGRTLDHAFVILDEAQNATSMQIKMFLTRLGPSAKCVITGDLSQVDLPRRQRSGLVHAIRLLENLDGIATVRLSQSDVVRHRLVRQIIKAYEEEE